MTDEQMYLNLVDEIDLICNRYLKDANRTKELNDLCGMNGEAPDPYEVLLRQLEFVWKNLITEYIDVVVFLQTHKHSWDDDDFCIFCGADGRA
jgi:hypothetical protein